MTNVNSAGTVATDAATRIDPIPQLNSLLRGEISAAETYRMAIDRVAASDSTSHLALLGEIQEEHGRAAQQVRDRIRELGGQATESSGAWGAWAKTVQATMNFFGDASSLKALKEGEEHGLRDYNDALGTVDPASRQLIQNQLIPQQQRHIDLLDQISSATGKA
jgi:bacterioferritin (cytochrome b1)